MHRAVDVLRARVVHIHSGKLVGRVHDLLFEGDQLQGILLEKKNWFTGTPFVPISHIVSIGEDMVITDIDPHSDPPAAPEGSEYSFENGQSKVKGLPVITADGEQLGVLEDVYFQEKWGTIVGYELSDGFFSDLLEGRQTIRHSETITMGKDTLVVNQAEINQE